MRAFVLFVLAALVSILTTVSTAHAGPIATKSGNYCKDEVLEYFAKRFPGEKIEDASRAGWGNNWQFWVRSTACEGYLVFDFARTDVGQCGIPQYWSRSLFMRRVYARGACQEIMPHDEYPY